MWGQPPGRGLAWPGCDGPRVVQPPQRLGVPEDAREHPAACQASRSSCTGIATGSGELWRRKREASGMLRFKGLVTWNTNADLTRESLRASPPRKPPPFPQPLPSVSPKAGEDLGNEGDTPLPGPPPRHHSGSPSPGLQGEPTGANPLRWQSAASQLWPGAAVSSPGPGRWGAAGVWG